MSPAQRYAGLRAVVGDEVLRSVEQRITLFHVDRCWAAHLARVTEVREGIHLFSVGGFNPLDEFHKMIAAAFRELRQEIDDEIVETFESAEITENAIDMEAEGLTGPSATWTYLVSDNPFGNWLERAFRRFKKALVR